MVNLPVGFHESLTNKFFELFDLYEEVKRIVFLAEYENKEQKYIISSVNELRNSLDHIMRTFGSPENLEVNFDKAKGHLYRAGYDAYEIIAISKLAAIKEIKEQFKFEAITIGYPDYFSKVVPVITTAKNELVSARANKKIDNGLDVKIEEKHFNKFEKITTELIKIVDNLDLHIDGIIEAQREIRRKYWRNVIITTLLSSLIIGFVLLVIEYKFFVPKESKGEVTSPKTEQLKK
jgi:hypothetical protein